MGKNWYSITKAALIFSILFVAAAFNVAKADESSMPRMKITYDREALNYYTYIPGKMELTDTDGTVTVLNTEFKTRGASALKYTEKPALNMKLKDDNGSELDVNLLGLRKASSFILDAMAIDRINMRNRVAFDIWNDFSRLPYETDFDSRNGTVGKFVELYINEKYKGIYCISDKINRKLLDLKKPETDDATGEVTVRGLLYKNGTNDIEDQNTPGYYNDFRVYVADWHDAWELHEPEDYASEAVWQPLADLYKGKNYEKYSYVKDHFWLENLADYTIHVMALCIADNWGTKNRYFSIQNVTKADDRSRFVVTPWDLDTSFGGEYDGSCFGQNLKKDWKVSDIDKSAPVPISICLAQNEFREIMKSRWETGREGAFSVESVCGRLKTTAAFFIESGAWQRTVAAHNADDLIVEDLEGEIDLICRWYENRFKDMDEYFGISERDNGIVAIGASGESEPVIFNLQGVRIDRADEPGLYIINGKKVLVK